MSHPRAYLRLVRSRMQFSPSCMRGAGVRLFQFLYITVALLIFAASITPVAPGIKNTWQGEPPTHKVTLYPPTGSIVPSWKVRRPWMLSNGSVCWRGGEGPDIRVTLPTPILRGWVCITGTIIVEPM